MMNPLNDKPMNAEHGVHVGKLKTIRRNAKKAARSGNPARRAPAERVLARVGSEIGYTYGQDVALTAQKEGLL